MKTIAGIAAGALVFIALTGAAVAQQQSGAVGSGPPEDLFLETTLAPDGAITLSQNEFRLAWGGYYRFNLLCPADGIENEAGIAFNVTGLWPNSHIRLISVSDSTSREQRVPEINFHLQGLQVGMIECEGLSASARVAFHPMRKGTYPFVVINDTVDPPVEAKGTFIVE